MSTRTYYRGPDAVVTDQLSRILAGEPLVNVVDRY